MRHTAADEIRNICTSIIFIEASIASLFTPVLRRLFIYAGATLPARILGKEEASYCLARHSIEHTDAEEAYSSTPYACHTKRRYGAARKGLQLFPHIRNSLPEARSFSREHFRHYLCAF